MISPFQPEKFLPFLREAEKSVRSAIPFEIPTGFPKELLRDLHKTVMHYRQFPDPSINPDFISLLPPAGLYRWSMKRNSLHLIKGKRIPCHLELTDEYTTASHVLGATHDSPPDEVILAFGILLNAGYITGPFTFTNVTLPVSQLRAACPTLSIEENKTTLTIQ